VKKQRRKALDRMATNNWMLSADYDRDMANEG
jgi:hypothetical protein